MDEYRYKVLVAEDEEFTLNLLREVLEGAKYQVDFIITDDGYFKEGQSKSGLGTILFNTFTETWSINREDEKTILKFSLRN